ncbi:tRNA lysidine(34) synthetase TilS [Saccharicrinis aurantiacus]|uniref:tRNA lysidine(34) synthetase TilS n=1 Tax=Saccharicrinis aurantiacus TaxID=1849719 RepID=UPI000950124C|nr:tRNA lysidine(34) synthetase TilS [Saccharicrinis aurantiacus]
MLQQFKKYIHESCQVKDSAKVLVALSGGADSMVLLHLLSKANIPVIAAHCNFNLRGSESDADEDFVRTQCEHRGIKLYVEHFETKEYAATHKVSIEMAARDLRYAWFNKLIENEGANYIATGHHKDDSIETFFLNLTRGTGIKGLTGIKPKVGNIIRPLLTFTRTQIEEFCKQEHIQYVTDSSNLESVYTRNKIRNKILPLFKQINPSFAETMMQNMDVLSQVEAIKDSSVEAIRNRIVVDQDGEMLISRKHLNELDHLLLFLFDLLKPLTFNSSQIKEIATCLNTKSSGKQFFSRTHRLIIDRFNIIVLPKEEGIDESLFFIDSSVKSITDPLQIDINSNIEAADYTIKKDSTIGQFDADLLEYPLTVRRWKHGDQFRPLGMKNFKKLSDFFIDQKYSLKQKEDAWLLLSGDDIIWIIGDRGDDRYKITAKTKRVITFQIN